MYQHNAPIMDDVLDYAAANNLPNHVAAVHVHSPHVNKPSLWPEVLDFSEAKKIESPDICVSQRGDLLTELAKGIDGYLQFPRSTIFLHAIGCIASAMTKAFKIEYGFSELPVCLYVITAQPPSTGKSEVNRRLFTPILKAYKALNDVHEKERGQLQREIKRKERQLENMGKGSDKYDEEEVVDQIEQKQIRLNEIPQWSPAVTNSTIEAIDAGLDKNDGMFNIVSAEAEAVNVVVGSVYGDGQNKSNVELLLKAWDGEWYASDRVSRNGYTGEVRASISVIAQDDTIDTLLAAGASGRGLTERFLMLSEKSKLGDRDHYQKYTFDNSMYERYKQLAANIINEKDVKLNFSHAAEEVIKDYKARLEPTMKDDGVNSHNLTTGFIGKADKQVRKLAAVLHTVDQWQDGADRNKTISDDYVYWAISIFDELAKTFINSADYMGYVGAKSEIQKLIEVFNGMASRGKTKTSVQAIRDLVKHKKPFKGSRNMTQKIKDVLPEMEQLNYCVVDGQSVYLNPRLK
ncbi:MAG: DUF3987 domain-containing protein [Glaciecola sp.]